MTQSIRTPSLILSQLDTFGISSSISVHRLDNLAKIVNSMQSQGEILVPFQSLGFPGYPLTGGRSGTSNASQYQLKLWTHEKYSTHDRIWILSFFTTGSLYTGSISCSVNGNQYFTFPINGPGYSVFNIRETLTGTLSQTGSHNTINIIFTGSSTNTAQTYLASYSAFELHRPYLLVPNDANNKDNAVNPSILGPFAPISDYDNSGNYGPRQLAISISSSRNAVKQASSFCYSLPFTASLASTAYDSFWQISGSGQKPFNGTSIPFSLRHLYGDPTTQPTDNAIYINVFGWASGAANSMATASIVFRDNVSGNSVTMTANGARNSGSWYRVSFSPTATNPASSLPYAIGTNASNYLQITGTLSAGTAQFVVGCIQFGERNPC